MMWLCAALVVVSALSFWAGMRVERKRQELQEGMATTMEAIDRDRDARAQREPRGEEDVEAAE